MWMLLVLVMVAASLGGLEQARTQADRAALERMSAQFSEAASRNPGDARAHYEAALAWSYSAEVALQQNDKQAAAGAAESGIRAAREAVKLSPKTAEYHRILGTLCGQVIPANVLLGLRYGQCAKESIDKALELDPKSARAYVSRGVGQYYLPPALGGSVEKALQDFQRASQLDAKLVDSYVWSGLALRKLNRHREARSAFGRALQLNPAHTWAKQQLEKTPVQ
jgi:tetratricopeptide (TPR) repeat protein